MDNTTRQHRNKCQPYQNAEENDHNEEHIGPKKLITIGLVLVKCVRRTDRSFGGIIINTYISCLLMSTATQYVGSTLFFNRNGSHSFHLYVSGCLSVALLSFLRLLYLTNIGQNLGTSMKNALRTLNRVSLKYDDTKYQSQAEWNLTLEDYEFLRTELTDQADSPINPCSAFSLSNGTLVGTFANILTYLIVLIQFKGSEKG